MSGPTITRELVRDPVELIFEDGKRYATQRWVTRCDDWREVAPLGRVNFGWVELGKPFPTADSVPSPYYEPPPGPSLCARIMRALVGAKAEHDAA